MTDELKKNVTITKDDNFLWCYFYVGFERIWKKKINVLLGKIVWNKIISRGKCFDNFVRYLCGASQWKRFVIEMIEKKISQTFERCVLSRASAADIFEQRRLSIAATVGKKSSARWSATPKAPGGRNFIARGWRHWAVSWRISVSDRSFFLVRLLSSAVVLLGYKPCACTPFTSYCFFFFATRTFV